MHLAVQSSRVLKEDTLINFIVQQTLDLVQLIFQTNADVLIGHEGQCSVLGIQANTNITGVITAAGLTTISLNNPITQTIPAGTIIEFERGASPMVFESTYTQGNFVDDIIIANGGLGFTNGQYFDVEISWWNRNRTQSKHCCFWKRCYRNCCY